jgi:hypothetical protein
MSGPGDRDVLETTCERLLRDAGGRKVILCNVEGAVLAHAGEPGILDELATEAVAQLLGGVLSGGETDALALTGDVVARFGGGLSACAAPLESRAALVVLFDASTSLERVRVKMRRVRPLLVSNLPDLKSRTSSTPSAS